MNKVTHILLAIGLILAVATPALAEFKLNGFYRLMGYAAEVRSGATLSSSSSGASADTDDEEGDSRQFIDQRLRLMATYSLNDNVAIVYFAEIDTVWGTAGGSLGADNVNVETKNAYLDLKSGDTKAKLGIQAVSDVYQGVLFADDFAAATVNHKMGNATFNLIYGKFYEDSRSDDDDIDMYDVGVKFKVNDNFNVGANVNYMDMSDVTNMRNDTVADYIPESIWQGSFSVGTPTAVNYADDKLDAEIWTIGVNADAKFGSYGLSGFALYQDLSLEADDFTYPSGPMAGDYDGSADGNAWLATVKGSMKLDNGDVGLRFLYVSPNDDDDDGADQWVGNLGEAEFGSENLMQFLYDGFVCNYGKESYVWNDAVDHGYGLMAFMLSGNHKLPQDMYLKWGAGYFMAAKEDADGATGEFGERGDVGGDELGWEIAARFGKKYFEKVDVSLNASYADYGDFYDNTAENGDDPDATYKTYLMVSVPF